MDKQDLYNYKLNPMKSALMSILGAVVVSGSASNFPSFDIFHSHCGLNVQYQGQFCYDIYDKLKDTLNTFNAGGDPAHGTYQFKEEQAITYIWAIHKSKDGNLDDVIFETN